MKVLDPRFCLLVLLLVTLSFSASVDAKKKKKPNLGVTYDGTSLIVNGRRELIYSGSVHYPRSTPDMWPSIIKRAKQGGLNTIQTYVFWNMHEPVQGQFNFTGAYDLVKFIKLIRKNRMYVTIRLGPFIQAEWTHGGLPYWLREVPGIFFRKNNPQFMEHTERYIRTVIDRLKNAKLFAAQGGPIILGVIENEYSAVQLAYKEEGWEYLKWAAQLVESMQLGIPWAMCKQNDAPDPMINTCNGRYCGDTFPGPNKPNKPSLWTENWTTGFRVYGDPPSQRSAEDIAYSVARFFSKNGSHVNYYMYHGGTNFGRNAAHFVTARYYDDAPLDEYGLRREPKYGHLKQLHKALNLCKKALLWGSPRTERPTPMTEIRYYEYPGACAAFLANNNTLASETINFRGQDFVVPPHSISILPDCKTLVYNTAQVIAQHSSRNFVKSRKANKKFRFKVFRENLPANLPATELLSELYQLTKDQTDYAWFTTSYNLDPKNLPPADKEVSLRIASFGHALHAWVNGKYLGFGHGAHTAKSFKFQKPIQLKEGENQIVILGVLTGFPDSGAYLEKRYTGPRGAFIEGLNSGVVVLSGAARWGNKAGMEGEKIGLHTKEGSMKVQWEKMRKHRQPVTWYKTNFDAPEGQNPVAIRLNGMGKGMAWVNGNGLGRYWMSFLSATGKPTQTEYHIPRSFLKPKKNLLVIFEEEPGVKPELIDFVVINRDTVCSNVSETSPPAVGHWKRLQGNVQVVRSLDLKADIKCSGGRVISAVQFASFGDPVGVCGKFLVGKCHAPASKRVVEKFCLGKAECKVPVNKRTFKVKNDMCPEVVKTLAVQVKCSNKKKTELNNMMINKKH